MDNDRARDKIVRAFTQTLKDFGYATLTEHDTEIAIRAIVNERPDDKTTDVIILFVERLLEDYPTIKAKCLRLFTAEPEGNWRKGEK